MDSYISVPRVLLPKECVDLKKWAVIACDQFTSQGEYWKKLKDECGEVSALNVIFPEYYLDKGDMDERIASINYYMNKYLCENVFREINGFVLTVRETSYGRRRTGLLALIDLDMYDFEKGGLPIRATEATVRERLPVRIKIRRNAPLELPHVLLLIDDKEKTVIEPIAASISEEDKLYDSPLNMAGGSIKGYRVKNEERILSAVSALARPERNQELYGSASPFVFAVGDGNHSVATAKVLWEETKKTLSLKERESHPARYFLAEINNLYDDDLVFEPIHRAVFGVGKEFIEEMRSSLSGKGHVTVLYREELFSLSVPEGAPEAVRAIQEFIDGYLSSHEGAAVDYIHGDENLSKVASAKDGVAIFMPVLKKEELFPYVVKNGSLPRKTFSMGEAEEKRYYLEARKIK